MNKEKMKIVTCFSGVGMQERGIDNTNLYDLELVNTCETDANAIISYAAIHNNLTMEYIDDYLDYPSREEMSRELLDMHINYDFVKDKEYNWEKVARSKDSKKQLQKTWLACKLTKNVGDITRVDEFPYCDMLTFSFPCTDLSIAGKQKGMADGLMVVMLNQDMRKQRMVGDTEIIIKNQKETC